MWKQLKRGIETATSRQKLRQHLRASLVRNALYLLVGNAITGFSGLAFWVVAAKWLYGEEEVGLASAAISAVMLLGLLATLGLDYALIRFLPKAGSNHKAMINSCLTLGGIASVVIALIFIAGLSLWSPELLFLRRDPLFLGAFVLFTAGWTLYMLTAKTFVAKRRSGYSLVQTLLFNLVRFPLVLALVAFSGAFNMFASWGLAAVLAVAVGAGLFLPRVQPNYRPVPALNPAALREMVRFSFTNYAVILLWNAPIFALPLLVVNLVGPEANAHFYIAWSIATVLFHIPLSVSFSLFAEGSHQERGLGREARRSLIFSCLLLCPAVLILIVLGGKILLLFNPAYSDNATELLWLLALSAIPLTINHIYFVVKRVEMRMASVVALNALIALSSLALSWALLPSMGITGAGVAWLSSQGVASVIIILLWAAGRRRRRAGTAATPESRMVSEEEMREILGLLP